MKIGIDIDGPVYPWHEEIYRYFQENKGYSKDIGEFWLKDRELVTEYYVTIPFLYNSTTPRLEVLEYLPKLAELGELYYITARIPDLWQVTRKFFDFYDLPFKENVLFEKNKATRVRLLGLDFFVDDMPKHVDSLKGLTDVYLFEVIHNREQREGYKTVASMREFYEVVKAKSDEQKEVYNRRV
jgi:uncharacterized HAD superfamily protein